MVTISHPTNQANFSAVTVGPLAVWFSYSTPIAFQVGHADPVVRQNAWSTTTGKHLNHVDSGSVRAKARRVPGDVFAQALAIACEALEPEQMIMASLAMVTVAGAA